MLVALLRVCDAIRNDAEQLALELERVEEPLVNRVHYLEALFCELLHLRRAGQEQLRHCDHEQVTLV